MSGMIYTPLIYSFSRHRKLYVYESSCLGFGEEEQSTSKHKQDWKRCVFGILK